MNKEELNEERRTYVKRVAETTKESKNCKHEWKIHEVKRWFVHGVWLYCSKCGSWKEIL